MQSPRYCSVFVKSTLRLVKCSKYLNNKKLHALYSDKQIINKKENLIYSTGRKPLLVDSYGVEPHCSLMCKRSTVIMKFYYTFPAFYCIRNSAIAEISTPPNETFFTNFQ